MLLCAVVFQTCYATALGPLWKKNNVTTHRVTSQTFTVLSFFVFELGNRQGAITIGSCRASTHSAGGLPLSFFFLFRHKYFWWPVISVWKSFAWKSISISRDMWNKKEMRNRILLSSGHPFPKSRLRRIGSIPFSFFFKFLHKRIKNGRVYTYM